MRIDWVAAPSEVALAGTEPASTRSAFLEVPMKFWRGRLGFWVALSFVLWLLSTSEVLASETAHPLYRVFVFLWPAACFCRLLAGVAAELAPPLLRRSPYVVAGGVAAWALIWLASEWDPEARDDFGLLTPGVVVDEALYSYPLTWALLVALGLWRLEGSFRRKQSDSVFGATQVIVLIWAFEVVRSFSRWFEIGYVGYGYLQAFLWLEIACSLLPLAVCLAARAGLRDLPNASGRSQGRIASSRLGERAAMVSVLFAAASLVALIERVNADLAARELDEARASVSTCEELERQLPERRPCGGAE